jgi:hypothetical protein
MSVEVPPKSVIIEGDKTFFASKGAIDRFKKDLKNDDKVKLAKNDYFKEGWGYKILSKIDNEIKVQILNNSDVVVDGVVQPRVINCDEATERRKLLKQKLKDMLGGRERNVSVKSKMKNVPDELADAYLQLKKVKLPVSLPDPSQVLANKEEYKNMVFTMIQSFGDFKGGNNPIINYYKLLAKHMGLPTMPMGTRPAGATKQPVGTKPVGGTENKADIGEKIAQSAPDTANEFLEKLRKQKNSKELVEVEDEMKKIYESIGLDSNIAEVDDDDEEMSNIYKTLGISKD